MTLRSQKPYWCPTCGRTTCEGCSKKFLDFTPILPASYPDGPAEIDVLITPTGPVITEPMAVPVSVSPGDTPVPSYDPSHLRGIGSNSNEVGVEAFLTGYLGDDVFARRFARCIGIIKHKNADYSQGEQKGDRIAAFRRISRDLAIPISKVWGVFFQKHWGAIVKYMKDGFVESESIHGRIDDAINYLVLFGAIVDDEEETRKEQM